MMDLAAVVGPTGVGKTAVSILVGQMLGGELISCDSMQVYRRMDIGTAKATLMDRQRITHHLIDIIDPDENKFSVADYQKLAKQAINEITSRGKLPILVGGTGLYYQAVVDDYNFFPIESTQAAREKWELQLHNNGLESLYKQLVKIDKEYADKIGANDKKRIIRALEVFDLTGMPFSYLQTRKQQAYNLVTVGLYLERQILYARIEDRVDKMIEKGLIDEVAALRKAGYDLGLNSMQALGYKQVYYYLEGLLTKEDMIAEIKRETRRFAKRQFTWFNKDKRIRWFNVSEYQDTVVMAEYICKNIRGQLFVI